MVWGEGKHIGFYLGEGKALSALFEGVKVHDLEGITWEFTTFLRVDWAQAPTTETGSKHPVDPIASGTGGEDTSPESDVPVENSSHPSVPDDSGWMGPVIAEGYALGSMNLRAAPGPGELILGWVGRRGTFSIVGEGRSPSGAHWFQVIKRSGKSGWVYSRWVDAHNYVPELPDRPAHSALPRHS